MGWWALMLSGMAAVALAVDGPGLYGAMGLAIAAVASGAAGYRRRGGPAGPRLAGVTGIAFGGALLALAFAKYGLVLAAIGELEHLAR